MINFLASITMTEKEVDEYLKNFFDEKEISYKSWNIETVNGVHFIDSDVVIEAIKGAPYSEKHAVSKMLMEIDYYNQPVEPCLLQLAKGLAVNYPSW